MGSRQATILIALVALLGGGASWLLFFDVSRSVSRLRVVQRLDRPSGVLPFEPVQLASTAQRRWTAQQIETQWKRLGAGASRTYRSPAMGTRALFAVVATFPSEKVDRAATLLWSTGSTLTQGDFARNRRELRSSDDSRSLVLRGDGLHPDAQSIQHLFVHVPAGVDLQKSLEGLSVLETSELTKSGAAGPLRATLDGEVRDLVLTSPGARVSYEVDAPELAFIAFGVHVAGTTPVTLRVSQRTSKGATELFSQDVTRVGWHDFRAPLGVGGRQEISFEATSEAGPRAVTWSSPILLTSDQQTDRPNIVLYVVDALRADALGLYGSDAGRSPVLDRLGREGLVFSRAYSASSWTKPSVTTMLTSLYPMTHGLGARFYTDPLPPTVSTLQSVLAADGYLTAQFSANPFTGTVSNLDRGFDVAVTSQTPHERILTWLNQHPSERFFAYIHTMGTHPPFSVAARTPRESYDASLASVDAEIGTFRGRLAALGFGKNTLFVLTADHGEAFGEHGREGHGQSVYDEEVRVPLILHWPERIPPGTVSMPVHHVDLFPTILSVAGVPSPPSQLRGRSLWPVDPSAMPSPVVVSRFVYPEDADSPIPDRSEAYAIVDFPWKLIAFDRAGAPRRTEIYRLDADPLERKDLSGVESKRVSTLSTALDGFLSEEAGRRARFFAEHAKGRSAPSKLPSRELLDQLRSLGYVR